MKQIQILFYVLLFSVIGLNHLFSQEKRQNFTVNTTLAHYIRSNEDNTSTDGTYTNLFNIGIEGLYLYQFNPVISLSSGLAYQRGRMVVHFGNLNKFRFGEISLPLISTITLNPKSSNPIFFSSGLYAGKLLHLDWEVQNKSDNWVNTNLKYEEKYSDKNFFIDLYFDVGIQKMNRQFNYISIIPFARIRINDNWFGYYHANTYYGIKICYQFKLKRNENQ